MIRFVTFAVYLPKQLAEYSRVANNERQRELSDATCAHGEGASSRRRSERAHRLYQGKTILQIDIIAKSQKLRSGSRVEQKERFFLVPDANSSTES